MDLTQTLIAAGQADKPAEAALREWETRNFPEFVNGIAVELATEGKDPMARQLAGLYIKNLLYSKNDAVQRQKHDAWKGLEDAARSGVKHNLLQAMRSPQQNARQSAAQAAAEVATIEMPYDAWPEFLPAMLANVTDDAHSEGTKVASLTCLGYTCERMAYLDLPEIPTQTVDAMLTTIVDGIQKARPNSVRYAAASALRNSFLFTQSNMERVEERNAIMSTVCEATQSTEESLRKEAFACINTVAFLFYEKLSEYMMTFFELTTKTIQNDKEEVATEAIEFWNTIAEVELDLLEEERMSQEAGDPPEQRCARYTEQAIAPLIPILLEAMTKQEDGGDIDNDQFGLSMAAATCLRLVSDTVGDAITNAVIPFVHSHIQSEDWHYREAATMAFASILEGVSAESIGAVVHQSVPVLMNALNDPVDLVKDSTLYTISRICEYHTRAIPHEMFPTLINGLMTKLTEHPRVAKQACNALHKLGIAFDGDETGDQTGTNQLSQFLPTLLQQLLACADRPDANEANLRVQAFEGINVFVSNSAPDCKPLLLQLFPVAKDRLVNSFALQGMDKDSKEGLQSLLCGLLQVLIQKLDRTDVTVHADAIMQGLLQVLQANNSSAQVEALAAIGALANSVEEDFEKYMASLQPYLLVGLRQFDRYQVCNIAVGLVGDIARAIEVKILPFTNDIMQALIESLKDSTLHRSVKPTVLACFGEIAMALTDKYEPYVQHSLMLLMQASAAEAPQDDDEMIDYINQLRENVLEAYTGIVNGLDEGNRLNLLATYIPALLQFLQKIANDPNRDDHVLGKAVGLIGDIAKAMGPQIKDQINQPFVGQLLQAASRSGEPETAQVGQWAMSVVQNSIA